jgi:hypothetical protein
VNRRNGKVIDLILCIAKNFAIVSMKQPAPLLCGTTDFARSYFTGKQGRRIERLLCEVLREETTNTTRRRTR